MYNRYIPSGTAYEQVPGPDPPPRRPPQGPGRRPSQSQKGIGGMLEGVTGKLGAALKGFHLEGLDSGDILLILIILFLFLESDDDLELVITLGLLLAFGLFGKDEDPEQADPCRPD